MGRQKRERPHRQLHRHLRRHYKSRRPGSPRLFPQLIPPSPTKTNDRGVRADDAIGCSCYQARDWSTIFLMLERDPSNTSGKNSSVGSTTVVSRSVSMPSSSTSQPKAFSIHSLVSLSTGHLGGNHLICNCECSHGTQACVNGFASGWSIMNSNA